MVTIKIVNLGDGDSFCQCTAEKGCELSPRNWPCPVNPQSQPYYTKDHSRAKTAGRIRARSRNHCFKGYHNGIRDRKITGVNGQISLNPF
jgi:hypothetical protein